MTLPCWMKLRAHVWVPSVLQAPTRFKIIYDCGVCGAFKIGKTQQGQFSARVTRTQPAATEAGDK